MGDRHGRAQSLLLIQKLLDCRDNSSPFILVLDTIEHSARPLLREYIRRTKTHKTRVVFVAYETLRPPAGVDEVLRAYDLAPATCSQRITTSLRDNSSKNQIRTLVIFDSLRSLASDASINISQYLGSLIAPNTTLLTVYHVDQPLSRPGTSPYSPSPLTLLKYLATSVLTLHSFAHVLAAKAARERSLAPPRFGLDEEKDGIIHGLGSSDIRGVVVELEHRRKSGRAVAGLYFLPNLTSKDHRSNAKERVHIMLLAEHPLYSTPSVGTDQIHDGSELDPITFNLGLTEKQRRDRDDVVLPYYDAQGLTGPGEGGRILYDMGVEDDFDDEEDEI